MCATAAAGRARSERGVCPSVGVRAGQMGRRFGHTVFVVDAHIGVLVQQHQIDGFGGGAQACDVIGCGEALWLAIVVPNRSGKCQRARKIDAPIAIQIIMAAGIANGQIIVRWSTLLDHDVRGLTWDQ